MIHLVVGVVLLVILLNIVLSNEIGIPHDEYLKEQSGVVSMKDQQEAEYKDYNIITWTLCNIFWGVLSTLYILLSSIFGFHVEFKEQDQ
ncbi:hypothetical protein CYY_008111 [Polysphondylium violaceum]|uniref:Transmembrane protein n=1 Tax=Polysphondylium violaceum TaxID=133409 RepID=A0A8J4PQW3_9MYCE|nr:hypothetical protein CYY_008111 [Polysphondylium violaceum]